MALFLFRFWPVLIPLIIYLLWMFIVRNKAKRAGEPLPHFKDGPWFWAVVAALATGIVIFIILGLSHQPNTGNYVPPKTENGRIIPGHVE
jgi:hypothetical protein